MHDLIALQLQIHHHLHCMRQTVDGYMIPDVH